MSQRKTLDREPQWGGGVQQDRHLLLTEKKSEKSHISASWSKRAAAAAGITSEFQPAERRKTRRWPLLLPLRRLCRHRRNHCRVRPVASAERLGHSWLQRSLESVIFPPAVCPAKRQLSITREEEVVGYWEQLAPAVSATVLWGREARLRRRGWLIALPPPPLGRGP